MDVVKYLCANCGYTSVHELGTPDIDQTLSDVNTEFSNFQLFVCPKERRLLDINVLDPGFLGKCPSDSAALTMVENARQVNCPKCGRLLSVVDIKLVASADSGSE